MKKNIKVALVFILIILNIIAGGFIIFLFFTVNSPSIYAEIDITELTSEEIQLETLIDITNPNPFDLTLKNIKVVSKTNEDDEFTRYSFKGGEIPSNEKKTYLSNDSLRFNGSIPKVLINTITADIGVRFLGIIEKIIPIKAVIILSIDDFIYNITVPEIKIHAGIDEITEEGLIFFGDIEISNPSNIELSIDDIFVELKTGNNTSVGSININGGILLPYGTLNLEASGLIMFEALNANNIIIDLDGIATINIAGITQSIKLSTSTAIEVPDLKELLKLNNDSFDFSLIAEFKVRLRGIVTTIDFKIYNPSNIPLEVQDINCIIYGITGDKKKIIVEKEMQPCDIPPKNEVCITTKLRIPYLKLFFSGSGRILPKQLGMSLEGNFAINGTYQTIPISINGYIDPYIFR